MVGLIRRGGLYRVVCSDQNMTEAWHRVRTQSADTPGVDGISLAQFQRYLFQELRSLQKEFERGAYEPLPLKVASIPKRNGERRPIGILAVRDRVAQVALLNVVEPLFEPQFANASYGYRPGRSTAMALGHVAQLVNSGLHWTVRFDIEDCFESINCARLRKMLSRTVKDRRVRQLIRRWLALDAQRMVRRQLIRERAPRGLVQGSPLSPFLANVYLDRFDKEMGRRGLHWVRYADDVMVLARSQREARKALRKARRILRALGLAVNLQKTRVGHVEDGVSFLGATLTFQDGERGEGAWIPVLPSPPASSASAGADERPRGDGLEISHGGEGAGWEPST